MLEIWPGFVLVIIASIHSKIEANWLIDYLMDAVMSAAVKRCDELVDVSLSWVEPVATRIIQICDRKQVLLLFQ